MSQAACKQSLVIADMPFNSYEDTQSALSNAKALIDHGAEMIKIEGGIEHTEVIKA